MKPRLPLRSRVLLALGLSFALVGAGLGALAGFAERTQSLAPAADAPGAGSAWSTAPLLALAIVSGMAGLVLGLASGVRRGHRP